MNKTLLRKLNEKHLYTTTPIEDCADSEDMRSSLIQEMMILREAAKDLLQPRPQAIANILNMARTL